MIVILTDFGQSEYLGVMKGVIYSICPKVEISDLYNNVTPHKIREGAWILLQNYAYFPKGTIFLCVVDPGVGSERAGVAIHTNNYCFIGPDNGLLYPAVTRDGIKKVFVLSEEDASSTFHGRDIFAKAAGLLERDRDFTQLGEPGILMHKLEFFLEGRIGEIVRIDHFGNIITNLPSLEKGNYTVVYKTKNLSLPFYKTYESAEDDTLFLIKGSCNTLEISIKNSKAISKFKVNVGDKIEIT